MHVTDIDTRYFEVLFSPEISVELRDLTTDPPAPAQWDLIHARAVVEHVTERERIVPELAAALRPGGRLVLEDISVGDSITQALETATYPESSVSLTAKAMNAMAMALRALGADPHYGMRLPVALRDAGLIDVGAEVSSTLVHGGSRPAKFYILSLQLAAERLVAAGLLTQAEVERHIRFMSDPNSQWLSLALVSAWGRRRP